MSCMDDTQDTPVDVNDACVPADVRERVLSMMQPGDQLWRCPRLSAPRGSLSLLGIGERSVVIEWWLVDAQGELIEAFFH